MKRFQSPFELIRGMIMWHPYPGVPSSDGAAVVSSAPLNAAVPAAAGPGPGASPMQQVPMFPPATNCDCLSSLQHRCMISVLLMEQMFRDCVIANHPSIFAFPYPHLRIVRQASTSTPMLTSGTPLQLHAQLQGQTQPALASVHPQASSLQPQPQQTTPGMLPPSALLAQVSAPDPKWAA